MAAVAREVIEAYGDASGWAMANPVGTGPYRLKEWRRGSRSCSRRIRVFARSTFPTAPSRPTRERVATMQGQEAAADRPRRDLDHRGVESAAARVRQRRSSTTSTLPPDLVANVLDAGEHAASREYADAGRDARTRLTQPALSVHVLQHGRSRSSAATRKEKIALRRAIVMGFNTDEMIKRRAARGRRCRRRSRFRRTSPATTPSSNARAPYDPRGGEGAARQVRLHRSRRRRLARAAGRQAADAVDGIDAVGARPRVRRAVEEEHDGDRHPDRVRQAEVARPAEDGPRRAAADVAGRLDQRVRAKAMRSCGLLYSEQHRANQLSRASRCPSTTSSIASRSVLPDGPSATRSTGGWRSSSPPTSRGMLRRVPDREHAACGRGCSGTRSTRTGSTRGSTSTSHGAARGPLDPRRRGNWCLWPQSRKCDMRARHRPGRRLFALPVPSALA